MTYQLAPNEKITVINQHLRTLAFSKYNYEVSLMEEQALSNPSQETLDSLNLEIELLNSKIEVLIAEIATIEQSA